MSTRTISLSLHVGWVTPSTVAYGREVTLALFVLPDNDGERHNPVDLLEIVVVFEVIIDGRQIEQSFDAYSGDYLDRILFNIDTSKVGKGAFRARFLRPGQEPCVPDIAPLVVLESEQSVDEEYSLEYQSDYSNQISTSLFPDEVKEIFYIYLSNTLFPYPLQPSEISVAYGIYSESTIRWLAWCFSQDLTALTALSLSNFSIVISQEVDTSDDGPVESVSLSIQATLGLSTPSGVVQYLTDDPPQIGRRLRCEPNSTTHISSHLTGQVYRCRIEYASKLNRELSLVLEIMPQQNINLISKIIEAMRSHDVKMAILDHGIYYKSNSSLKTFSDAIFACIGIIFDQEPTEVVVLRFDEVPYVYRSAEEFHKNPPNLLKFY